MMPCPSAALQNSSTGMPKAIWLANAAQPMVEKAQDVLGRVTVRPWHHTPPGCWAAWKREKS